MTFEQILPKLRKGAYIARFGWPVGYYLYPSNDTVYSNDPDKVEPYTFQGDELFADDWYVYSDGDECINEQNQ